MRFNNPKKKQSGDTLNLAGGEAFTESAKLELVSILLTSTLGISIIVLLNSLQNGCGP